MTLADVYEHNAKECREAAERTYNATHRAALLKTAHEWWQDAEAVRASHNCCEKDFNLENKFRFLQTAKIFP